MLVTVFVIADRAPLDALLSSRNIDMNNPVFIRFRRQNRELNGIQSRAGVAVRDLREKTRRVIIHRDRPIADALLFVRQRPLYQRQHSLRVKRLQLKNPRPR